MTSPEYLAVTRCVADINSALASTVSLGWFGDRLLAEEIISQNICDNVNILGLPDYNKAGDLMRSVLTQIRLNPKRYYTFLGILEEEPALSTVVRKLQGELNPTASAPTQRRSAASEAVKQKDQHTQNIITLKQLDLELHEVSEWYLLGLYAGLSPAELDNIKNDLTLRSVADFRTQVLSTWMKKLPGPSWSRVAQVVADIGRKSLARKIALKYESDPLDKERLRQALQSGYTVKARISKVMFIGAAGTGKSSLMAALVGVRPDDVRNSTACAERGVRAIASHRAVVLGGMGLRILDPGELERMIMKIVNEKRVASYSRSMPERIQRGTTRQDGATLQQGPSPQHFEELFEQLREHPPTNTTEPLDEVDWMIMVDTGGQPMYHEVLRAFVRNPSLNLIIFRLVDELDGPPCSDYFRGGKFLCKFGCYNITNMELIEHLLRGTQSCLNAKSILVGTHNDLVSQKKFSDIDRKLTSQLGKYEEVIEANQSKSSERVFPVSVKRYDQDGKPVFTVEDKRCLAELRQRIIEYSEAHSLEKLLPLAWYALEVRMEKLRREGKKTMTLNECLEVARDLHIDDLDHALQYLDELGLIIYLPEVLREHVFIDPQVLLDMVSRLIEKCCLVRARKDRLISCSLAETDEFRDKGVFSVELLSKCFPDLYKGGTFSAQNFVDLLVHLLIAAPFCKRRGDQCYFMPCLLEPKDDPIDSSKQSCLAYFLACLLKQFCAPFDHTPLLVCFEKCPIGLFCALVAYFLSSQKRISGGLVLQNTEHVSRHCVAFKAKDYHYTVNLVDNYHWQCFEVHTNAPNRGATFRQNLALAVLEGIQEVSNKHHYGIDYELGFFCRAKCHQEGQHTATVPRELIQTNPEQVCSPSESRCPLSEEEKNWLSQDVIAVYHPQALSNDTTSHTPPADNCTASTTLRSSQVYRRPLRKPAASRQQVQKPSEEAK